jgi:hypothetical protein
MRLRYVNLLTHRPLETLTNSELIGLFMEVVSDENPMPHSWVSEIEVAITIKTAIHFGTLSSEDISRYLIRSGRIRDIESIPELLNYKRTLHFDVEKVTHRSLIRLFRIRYIELKALTS